MGEDYEAESFLAIENSNMNIFEIQQSQQDKEFVMKNFSLEFEVFADILKTAEEIPYIGSLCKGTEYWHADSDSTNKGGITITVDTTWKGEYYYEF